MNDMYAFLLNMWIMKKLMKPILQHRSRKAGLLKKKKR